MSFSQQQADLITENHELRERLKGALADLEAEQRKNQRAAETHARMDLKLQQMTAERNAALRKLERAGIR